MNQKKAEMKKMNEKDLKETVKAVKMKIKSNKNMLRRNSQPIYMSRLMGTILKAKPSNL